MKKIVLIYLLVIGFTSVCYSQVEDLIVKGNSAYQEEKFTEAISLYTQIIGQGYESAALNFNLANSYYRNGELGNSILFYEKALKLDSEHEDAIYNLGIANAHTVDKIKELPKLFIAKWWDSLVSLFSISGWSNIVIILDLTLVILIGVYFFFRNISTQRLIFILGSANLLLLVFTAILLFSRVEKETSTDHGVLLTDTISVKVSPDEKSNDAFVLHEGVKFAIEDELQDWSKIKLSDGKVGWLPKNSFGTI
ncbi:MAG: tetratricopeptide repeat protein [Melioribacteraceae bacterium]|nr:tetratricopeptide repeat protein [Melioribacteraceae bacterium]